MFSVSQLAENLTWRQQSQFSVAQLKQASNSYAITEHLAPSVPLSIVGRLICSPSCGTTEIPASLSAKFREKAGPCVAGKSAYVTCRLSLSVVAYLSTLHELLGILLFVSKFKIKYNWPTIIFSSQKWMQLY